MKDIKRNRSYFVIGSLIVLASLLLLVWKHYFIAWVIEATALVIGVYGLIQLYQVFIDLFNKNTSKSTDLFLLTGFASIFFGTWLMTHKTFSVEILSYIIGSYQIIIGLINLLNYYLLRHDDAKDPYWSILYASIHILMGLSTIVDSLTDPQVINRLALYVLFVGITYINDGREVFAVKSDSRNSDRKVRFPLPVIFQAFLPQKAIQTVAQITKGGNAPCEKNLKKRRTRRRYKYCRPR